MDARSLKLADNILFELLPPHRVGKSRMKNAMDMQASALRKAFRTKPALDHLNMIGSDTADLNPTYNWDRVLRRSDAYRSEVFAARE